jgi:hypothetical protein
MGERVASRGEKSGGVGRDWEGEEATSVAETGVLLAGDGRRPGQAAGAADWKEKRRRLKKK